jgi:hypothetical protein
LNQKRLLAYWQLTHATEQITGSGKGGEMTDADLRRALSRPASLGDILEAWMMTNPRKGKSRDSAASQAALRRDMKRDGATDAGLDFWFGGN